MVGKAVLVTGATSGIGRETARELALGGAEVLVHGRDEIKARDVAQALVGQGARYVVPVWGDFTSLEEVRALAQQVRMATDRLHVLVNNAGVFMPDRVITPDGFETTLQVNHLAGFLLTNLLRSLLIASAPARVVTVSSITHLRGEIDLDDLGGEHGYDGQEAYAASKLMNVLFAVELSDILAGTGVTSNALHPGVIDTKLLHAGFPEQAGADVTVGAATPVYLASSREVEDVSGRFFVNQRPGHVSPLGHDEALRRRLWAVSELLVGIGG